MAIVPTTPGPSVESRPAAFAPQQAQFTPDAFGAGVGQATQGVGAAVGSVGRVLADIDHQNVVRAAKDADTEGRKAVTAAGFTHLEGGPDGNRGYFSLSGQAALNARPLYEKALQDNDTAIHDRMTDPRAQRLYKSQSGARLAGEIERSAGFSMQQGKVADLNSSVARIGSAADALSANFNDPKAYAEYARIATGEVSDQGRLAGWSPEELTQNTKAAVSKGYSGGILSALASGDVTGAARLFQTYAPRMDTTTRLRLAEHLEAPVRGAVADADIVQRMHGGAAQSTGNALDAIKGAIHQQESGGSTTAPTSPRGARGGWQIMPATFAEFAKPGESIDIPADNKAVGHRYIEHLNTLAGGDPERVAVGYFSGPGNMSVPGSPTPWKVDKHDGKKFTSEYVADVNRRMNGPPQAPKRDATDADPRLYPEFARVEQDIIRDFPPGKDRDARLSRLHASQNQYDRSTQTVRDETEKTFADKVAAAGAGNDTITLDKAAIRKAYRPAVSDYMIQQFEDAIEGGQMVKAVSLASEEKLAEMQKRLTAPREEGENHVKRQRMAEAFDRAVAHRVKALDKDSAAYAHNDPDVVVAFRNLDGSPEKMQAYVAASHSTQRGLGVEDVRTLTDAQAHAEAKKLGTSSADAGGKNPTDVGARIDALRAQYGDNYNGAWADIVRIGKLDPAFQAIAMVKNKGAQGDLQRAVQMRAENKEKFDNMPYDQSLAVTRGVDDALRDFEKTLVFGGADEALTVVRPALEALAKFYVHRGQSGEAAVAAAEKAILKDNFDFVGVTRTPAGKSGEMFSAGHTLLGELTAADLETGSGTFTLAQARGGVWATNPNGDGVVLMAQKKDGAGYLPVRDNDGNYISMKFDALPKPKRASWLRSPPTKSTVDPQTMLAPPALGGRN